jgi:hypothetical protein
MTPKQKRQAAARKIDRMMPANPKVKADAVTLGIKELRSIKRALEG